MRSLVWMIVVALSVQAAHAQISRARVTGGEVSGTAGNGMSIFKGIPFAAPPVGALRWKAPAPVRPWSGVKHADAFAHACMQAPNSQGNTAPVSEDCLYLNVWTPAKSASERGCPSSCGFTAADMWAGPPASACMTARDMPARAWSW